MRHFSGFSPGAIRDRTRPTRNRFRRWRRTLFGGYLRLLRRRTTFVAITGSAAKTTTTALLDRILKTRGRTRSVYYFNTISTIVNTVPRTEFSTRYFISEVGIGAEGGMKPMARVLLPDVAIVTLVGMEHKSQFRSLDKIAEEKGYLVAALRPGGLAVLNADDERVRAMAGRTKARAVTFGFREDADYRVLSSTCRFPGPLTVEIAWKGNTTTLSAPLVGEHFWVSLAAAFAAATELGVDPQTIAECCAGFRAPLVRAQPYRIENGPTFILDTNKAPFYSIGLALKSLADARAPRKRVVVGQISDGHSTQTARKTYRMAREVCDQVIYVGPNAKHSGAPQEDRDAGRFIQLDSVKAVADHIAQTASPDEVILLKGSGNMHLERIAMAMDREVNCWVDMCGEKTNCFNCGLYPYPFETHGEHARPRQPLARKIEDAISAGTGPCDDAARG